MTSIVQPWMLKLIQYVKSLPIYGKVITLIICLLVLVLFLFSCSGYRSVSLNVDKPEKVTFNMSDSITARVHK